jgi:hypothetical protein
MRSLIIFVSKALVLVSLLPSTIISFCQSQRPNEHLTSLSPTSGSVILTGSTVDLTAQVTFDPSPAEAVTLTTIFTVNGKRHRPFVTTLTPQQQGMSLSGSEAMIWPTHPPCSKHLTVRVQSKGIGLTSKATFEFFDISRTYPIRCNPKERWILKTIHKLFGCCEA